MLKANRDYSLHRDSVKIVFFSLFGKRHTDGQTICFLFPTKWLCSHLFWLSNPLVTGRNEVVAKVIFLHLFVIVFTGGRGWYLTRHWGRTPPDQTPPQSRPPGPGTHTPGQGTHTPPPPLPPGSRLRHTVYERPVRILLECILVFWSIFIRLLSNRIK